MTSPAFDIFTILHFFAGIIATYVLYPDDIFISFMIANFVHLVMELYENNIHPVTGEVLESDTNHVTDVISFFIGSIITIILYLILPSKYLCVENKILRMVLVTIIGYVIMVETVREVFPNYYLSETYKGSFL